MTEEQYINLLNQITYLTKYYGVRDKQDILHEIFLDGNLNNIKKSISEFVNRNPYNPRKIISCGSLGSDFEDETSMIIKYHNRMPITYFECVQCKNIFPEGDMYLNGEQYSSKRCAKCSNDNRRVSWDKHNKQRDKKKLKEHQNRYTEILTDCYIKKLMKQNKEVVTPAAIIRKRASILEKRQKKINKAL